MLMTNESKAIVEKTGGTGTDAEGNAVVDARLQAFLATLNTQKVAHGRLITQGICSKCAHCSMPLTDAASVERGLGPICSKKGYEDPPRDGDGVEAMIALAEYPQLVEFLLAHNEIGNLRGLMNALVKVCSLNRGNANLHSACCDAIEALGWRQLANAMRESIACMVLKASEAHPGFYEIWVKRAHWNWSWDRDVRSIPGAVKDRHSSKGLFVRIPVHAPVPPNATPEERKALEKKLIGGKFEGKLMTNKAALWQLMLRHFAGLCAKTPTGGVKILDKNAPKSEPPPAQ
jgi:hypothetical protein